MGRFNRAAFYFARKGEGEMVNSVLITIIICSTLIVLSVINGIREKNRK